MSLGRVLSANRCVRGREMSKLEVTIGSKDGARMGGTDPQMLVSIRFNVYRGPPGVRKWK